MLRLASLELTALDTLQVDALVAFVGAEERPLAGLAGLVDWRLCGALSRLAESGALSGEAGEALLTVTNGRLPAPKIFAFGLGPSASADEFDRAAERAAAALQKSGTRSVAIGMPESPRAAVAARALARAFARHPAEVVLVGDLQELALALPEAARRV